MLLAVSANNVGLMWIAMEATTIFSALIIPLKLSKTSVEASWKYIMIGSVGIALAFTGTVLAYFDFVALSGRAENALNWTVLLETAPNCTPKSCGWRLSSCWSATAPKPGSRRCTPGCRTPIPKRPRRFPPPMSGVLLAVALYAILRWKVVVDVDPGQRLHQSTCCCWLGLLSLVVARSAWCFPTNYKRMLAFSSIEHTGLTCLGLALGPLGTLPRCCTWSTTAAAKSMLFLLTGELLHRYRSTELASLSGLFKTMPLTGGLFSVGVLAIMGMPPFRLFHLRVHPDPGRVRCRAALADGRRCWRCWRSAFVALLRHAQQMLYGPPPRACPLGEPDRWQIGPLFLSVASWWCWG